MGHGALGIGHGAWGIWHWAWGMERIVFIHALALLNFFNSQCPMPNALVPSPYNRTTERSNKTFRLSTK